MPKSITGDSTVTASRASSVRHDAAARQVSLNDYTQDEIDTVRAMFQLGEGAETFAGDAYEFASLIAELVVSNYEMGLGYWSWC